MFVRYRQTARVIPVSAQGRVLLLCWHDPGHHRAPCWGTIGGGIEPGETVREAALRELWEETGIAVPARDIGEPFFRGQHTFVRNGIDIVATSTFFALSMTEEQEVRPAALDPGEVIADSRWWWPSELIDVRMQTPQLPQIIARAASVAATRGTPSARGDSDSPGGFVRDVADRSLEVQVVTSVRPEVIEILRPAVGSGSSPELSDRTRRVAEAATTVTGHHEGRLVAAVCIDVDRTRGRVIAIGVASGDRRRGWGRSLIAALPGLLGVEGLYAETDAEAVGFYRAIGFTVTSLGEKYPGVERFACRLSW